MIGAGTPGPPQLKRQYYALGQYTRFIRPGFKVISAGGAYNTLAAYSPAEKRLVLVTTNSMEAAGADDLDLTAFSGLPASARAYLTTADASTSLHEETIALASTGHLVNPLPPRSITTYVIDGLTPRPDVPSGAIEGVVV